MSNFEHMVSPQPVFFRAGLIDSVEEERLQSHSVWLMSKQRRSDPTSLRIAARIKPSMMSLMILRPANTQSHKNDTLAQE